MNLFKSDGFYFSISFNHVHSPDPLSLPFLRGHSEAEIWKIKKRRYIYGLGQAFKIYHLYIYKYFHSLQNCVIHVQKNYFFINMNLSKNELVCISKDGWWVGIGWDVGSRSDIGNALKEVGTEKWGLETKILKRRASWASWDFFQHLTNVPILHKIPTTKFSCEGKLLNGKW